ncbi:uncharacterized protein LOC131940911 isoform X2 [Physella acuta]|uniref:uncharacterized protein LOC131940911 isoform X2 n=1 Tax=Physella acuta TaxID=109671 RepID=UPI0027DE05F0|nr:uncharacterized protein LOC131940911 isoform X2 [Physella acuta]
MKRKTVLHRIKGSLQAEVANETWYKKVDNWQNGDTSRLAPKCVSSKSEREDDVFDLSQFKHAFSIQTMEVGDITSILPESRSSLQISRISRYMSSNFVDFKAYSLSKQRQISKAVIYCRYQPDRIIIKKGNFSNGLYFLLSGSLAEKHELKRKHNDILPGSIVGINDLLCSCRRQSTVVTLAESQLLYLPRKDCKRIFDLNEDSSDIKHLEIAKQHKVIHQFPVHVLEENKAMWTVMRYRYGCLISKDSNKMDWIYIIKSGEARVLKYMEFKKIKESERQRKFQAILNAESPFYNRHKILDFVTNREYIPSVYGQRKSSPNATAIQPATASILSHLSQKPVTCKESPPTRSDNLNTSNASHNDCKKNQKRQENAPIFVQLGTLTKGDAFGLRACLEPEEHGPSVSLVSGDCELLQINKKFFKKHCDESVKSLIRLEDKPYPSDDDLVDKHIISMQWENYKEKTTWELHRLKKRF